MILTFFLVFMVISFVCHVRWRYSRWGRLLSKIPGNRNWPIVGDLFLIAKQEPEHATALLDGGPALRAGFATVLPSSAGVAAVNFLIEIIRNGSVLETVIKQTRKWKDEFGRIYKLNVAGIAAVNIYHPEDVEAISSNTHKQAPYTLLRPWLGGGLFTNSGGEKYKQRRKLLTSAFKFNVLKRSCDTFNKKAHQLVQRLEMEAQKDRTKTLPLMLDVTLRIMCESSLGISLENSREDVIKKYSESLKEMSQHIYQRYFTLPYHIDVIYKFSPLAKKEKQLLKYLHRFTEDVIRERKKSLENNEVAKVDNINEENFGQNLSALTDLLLEQEEKGNIDFLGIREEVDTFLFAGHDTTGVLLSFMLMRLANEPEIQAKIYEEMMQIFGDSDRFPTLSDLNKMKYLERCIKESLRLYPPGHLIARYTTEEITLGGCTVPPDVIVHIHTFQTHRDPEIYPDPEKFDPDRFLPEEVAKRHPYAFLAFGAGQRNCIGQKFAMLEMKSIMSSILRRFVLEPVTKPEEIVFVANMVLTAKDPVYVRFKSRNCTPKNK